MSLPVDADVVVVRGYWWDEITGAGVTVNGAPATVKFDPVAFVGTSTPNLRDVGSRGYIKTRSKLATVDPVTGYFAAIVLSSDDPDLDAYVGRRVTFSGEPAFTIAVPHSAPVVTVDAAMADKTGLVQGSTAKALWLSDASVTSNPPPTPASSYLTSAQTMSLISDLTARVAALEGP